MNIKNGTSCIGELTIEDIASIIKSDFNKSILLNFNFKIPESNPDIQSISDVIIQSKINKSSIKKSIKADKIIFHGSINTTIVYISKMPQQTIHAAHYIHSFHSYISYIDLYENQDDDEYINNRLFADYKLKSYIEYIEPQLVNHRKIDITVILMISLKSI